MSGKEWSDQAKQMVGAAMVAAGGQDTNALLALQQRMLNHLDHVVLGVPAEVNQAFSDAMDALFVAIVNNTVQQWATLQKSLEACTVAIEGTAGEAAKAAKLISLQPVTGIAKELTTLVSEVKALKNNPQSADGVAQKLAGIQTHLANILSEARLEG